MGLPSRCYDPIILKVFSRVLQPYPIGAKLRLADGRYAVVVRFGKEYALLPEIIIAFDEDGQPLPKHLLEGPYKLEERTDLRIVSFAGEDLTDIYGDDPIYFDPEDIEPHAFETIFEGLYP